MMRPKFQHLTSLGMAAAAMSAAGAAMAAPVVSVTPPEGARFLIDQRFDLRVEVKTTSGSLPTTSLTIDGSPVTFSSNDSSGTTTKTYGFNLRAYSNLTPGQHTLVATSNDGSGPASATAHFSVINTFGGRRPAKNVIIMLGDGMGTAHRTAARIVRYGVTAGHPDGFLAMDKFPASGFVTTASLNSIVTDSAPGMSCYVSGNHNFNGQEGVYPATGLGVFAYPRVEYMSEYLHRKYGKSLGIVSTADIEDATPAANAIHTGNRGAGQGICDQYFDERNNSGLTVLLGGGRRWFLPNSSFGSSRSGSNDYSAQPADLQAAWNTPAGTIDASRDLIADFTGAGFTYTPDRTSLLASAAGATKLLGLFGYGNMNVSLDKVAKQRNPGTNGVVDDYHAPDQPMLDEMTDAAIKVLRKNANGFVLTVEGAHIDKQSHAMDADRAIWDTIEFDRAVQKAKDWADTLGDTVVIVTADHECSGFSVIGTLGPTVAAEQALASDKTLVNATDHPARQASVNTYDSAGFPHYTILADGFPSASDMQGKLLIGFGANGDRYEDWLTKPLPIVDSLLTSSIQTELRGKGYKDNAIDRTPESTNGFFVRGQVTGTQAVHTASDIPVTAYSTSSRASDQFIGVQENTDIFFKLMKAVGGGY